MAISRLRLGTVARSSWVAIRAVAAPCPLLADRPLTLRIWTKCLAFAEKGNYL